MNGNDFKSNLYAVLTESFLSNINGDNKDAVSEAYNSYLHERFDYLFDKADEDMYEKVATICKNNEEICHLNLTEEGKLAFLFPDDNFTALENVSFEIAGLARAKKSGDNPIISKQKEEYIEQIESLAHAVSPAFQHSAERLLSEALVDLVYLFDDDNIQSFRTATI